MIRALLSLFYPKPEPLDLGPYLITSGMRVRIRTARSRLSRRARADARARELRTARTRFLSAIGER